MGYASIYDQSSSFIEISGNILDYALIGSVAADFDFNSIVIPTLNGTIARVTLDIHIMQISNTSGALNYIQPVQYIKIDDGTAYRTAITVSSELLRCPANGLETGEFILCGSHDLKNYINAAGTYNVRWVAAQSLANDLMLWGCYPVLKIYFQGTG